MQNNFELPLFITIRPCGSCKIWTIFTHSGAILLLLPVLFPLPLKLLLALMAIYSLHTTIKKYCLLSHNESVIEIRLNEMDEWSLLLASGNILPAHLIYPVFVHEYLIVLNFTTDKSRLKKYRVVLVKNMITADSLRRLRVRLRFQRDGKGFGINLPGTK